MRESGGIHLAPSATGKGWKDIDMVTVFDHIPTSYHFAFTDGNITAGGIAGPGGTALQNFRKGQRSRQVKLNPAGFGKLKDDRHHCLA
jgi:hypothetical protein